MPKALPAESQQRRQQLLKELHSARDWNIVEVSANRDSKNI